MEDQSGKWLAEFASPHVRQKAIPEETVERITFPTSLRAADEGRIRGMNGQHEGFMISNLVVLANMKPQQSILGKYRRGEHLSQVSRPPTV